MWIDPRIADKVDPAMARHIFQCNSPQVEFIVVRVLYNECPRKANLFFVPFKSDIKCYICCC